MSELSLRPSDYNLADPEEIKRFLMTGQVELLNFLNAIESNFPQITELYTKFDIADADPNTLVKLDLVTYQYINALTSLHVFYQQLLAIRDIETPRYYTSNFYPESLK